MNYNDFEGIMAGLGSAFNKEYKKQELQLYYRYFKDYSVEVFINAVDNIITTFEKLPSLKQIIDKCDIQNNSLKWRKEYEQIGTPKVDKEWLDILNSFK